jgi:hypothetical protein
MQPIHNGSNLFIARCGSASGTVICGQGHTSGTFKAAATTITTSTGSFGGTSPTLNGDGTKNETFLELCQLPDTYVETTEW